MSASQDAHRELRSRLRRRRNGLLARLRRIWQWGLEDAETGGIGELSLYDQHPSDLGAELGARQVDFGLQQNMERMLEQVEKALKRIETGNYGTCERCGGNIDKERLEALPYVTMCIDCQSAVDASSADGPRHSAGVGARSKAAKHRTEAVRTGNGDAKDAWRTVYNHPASKVPVPRRGGTVQPSDEYATQMPGDEGRPVEELALEPPFGRTFRDNDDYAAFDGEDAWQDVARFGTANTPQDVPPAVDYDDVYVDADEPRGVVSEVDSIQDVGGRGVQVPQIYPDVEHEGEDSDSLT